MLSMGEMGAASLLAVLPLFPKYPAITFGISNMSLSKKIAKKYALDCCKKTCGYCGGAVSDIDFAVDHVEPKSKGGKDSLGNIILVCKSCNSAKSNRSLEWFRLHLSIKQSKFSGVINAAQYISLESLGVDIPLNIIKFHFEG
jgi:hypothetical protein